MKNSRKLLLLVLLSISSLVFASQMYVVGEVFSETWWGYCPDARVGIGDLYDTQDYVVSLIWEGDGSHPSPNCASRKAMYGVGGIPHAQFQGTSDVVGGGIDMLPYYTNQWNNFVNDESSFDIELDFGIANNQINLSANVLVTGEVNSNDDNSIHFIITYDYSEDYSCSVQRYTELDFDLTEIDETETYETSFELNPSWDLEKIRAVAMVQKMDGTAGNHPIHQAAIATVNSTAYVPNNLNAIIMENAIELNWEEPMILPFIYSVYRDGQFYGSVDSPMITTFIDNQVENGVTYEYRLHQMLLK